MKEHIIKRVGKIARLPELVREQLNRRLEQGHTGKGLVAWLNQLAEVKKVLAEEFGGRPIREQNLSDWKQGGYQDWVRHQEARQRMDRLNERAADLAIGGGEGNVSDGLSALLAAELAGAIEALLAEPLSPVERWKQLREILRDLMQMRREDHRAAWLRIGQERWEYDSVRLELEQEQREEDELRRIRSAPLEERMRIEMLKEVFGGGERGRELAARAVEFEEGLPEGSLSRKAASKPVEGNPAAAAIPPKRKNKSKSRRIKPDQATAPPIQPDQGGSSPILPDQGKEPGGGGVLNVER